MPETPEKAAPATASPRSSPTKKEIDVATMALNQFAQGKRHLLVSDIPSAVNSLQEACKLLAEQYGETAPECGDAYFCYGKALLEMARLESGVIGNALDGVPEGDDADNSQVENPEKLTDTEKDEVTELVDKALEENFQGLEEKKRANSGKEAVKTPSLANGHGIHTNGEVVNGDNAKEIEREEVDLNKKDAVNEDGKVDETNTVKDKAADTKGESQQKEGSTENEEEDDDSEADAESQEGSQDGEGEAQEGEEQEGGGEEEKEEVEGDKTEEDEEEVSNLQLAWEMLELAKVIFQKQEEANPKMKVKVAEVYLKLGEVGLESENYPQGIEDFKQCLEIQKSVLKSDDRCIAETHYQLGIAYSFCDDFDLAIKDFSAAVSVLETRIANLYVIKKEKESWTEKQRMEDAAIKVDPFHTEQGEIDELNQLLPEMKEKIVDMQQMKKDSIQRIKAAKEAMMSGIMGGEPSQGSSSKSPFDALQTSSSTNPFGAPESSSSKSPSGAPIVSSSNKEAKPIMVVRKKRKLEAEEGGEEAKKVKGESGESLKAVNGSKVANGSQAETKSTGENKDSSSKSATVVEMKEKAAEDVKKADAQSTS